MPKYKLNVPERGDYLTDGYHGAYVADTIDEARELLEEFEVHSCIGRCRVVHQGDVEDGECHEDAEPGDTAVDYLRDDGRRPLGESECLVWQTGPPTFWWSTSSLPPDPIHPQEVPVGCSIHHAVYGSTRTTRPPWEEDGRWLAEVVPWPRLEETRTVCLTADETSILPTGNWPELRVELTVQGETATGSKEEMEDLRCWAVSALEDEWRRNLPPLRDEVPIA